MTLEKSATFHRSTYLSPDDNKYREAKFKVGEKFLFRGDQTHIITEKWAEHLTSEELLLRINSLKESIDGNVEYELEFLKPYEGVVGWTVTEKDLIDHFHRLGGRQDATRFLDLE